MIVGEDIKYLANSTSESVTAGAQFFRTRSTFRGGAGHCRERSSPRFSNHDKTIKHQVTFLLDLDANLDILVSDVAIKHRRREFPDAERRTRSSAARTARGTVEKGRTA